MNREGLVVALSTSQEYAFVCGAFICNIIDRIPQVSAILVHYYDLDENTREAMLKVDRRVKLVKYTLEDLKREFDLDDGDAGFEGHVKKWTHLGIANFRLLNLLDSYNQVVYFDIDMLILDTLDELFNMKDINIIWRSSMNMSEKIKGYNHGVNRMEQSDIETVGNDPAPNGGFIVMNNNFDYKKAYTLAANFLKTCIKWGGLQGFDEYCFGYFASRMKLSVYNVDINIYNTPVYSVTGKTRLIHFFRYAYKPWFNRATQLLCPQWLEYMEKFKKISNINIDGVVKYYHPGKFMDEITFSDIWERILSNILLPDGMTIEPCLQKESLRIYFDALIECKAMQDFVHAWVEMYVNRAGTNLYPDLEKLIKNIADANDILFFEANENFFILKSKTRWMNHFSNSFYELYKLTKPLRSALYDSSILNHAKKGIMKTWHNNYLCVNDDKIVERQTPDCALEVYLFDKFVVLKDKITGLFVSAIDEAGYIKKSSELRYFAAGRIDDCWSEKLKDSYAIMVRDRHLSARNEPNGDIWLVPHCRGWERFAFVPDNTRDTCVMLAIRAIAKAHGAAPDEIDMNRYSIITTRAALPEAIEKFVVNNPVFAENPVFYYIDWYVTADDDHASFSADKWNFTVKPVSALQVKDLDKCYVYKA